MQALRDDVEAAYISCDVPLLVPAFVTRMFELLEGHDIAVPREGEQLHPLAAVYRSSVLPIVQRLLSADQLRPRLLFDEVLTRFVEMDELLKVDPDLRTLTNLNDPGNYQTALQLAGF